MEQNVIKESEQIIQRNKAVVDEKLNLTHDMESGRILGLLPVLVLLLVIFIRIAFVVYKSADMESISSMIGWTAFPVVMLVVFVACITCSFRVCFWLGQKTRNSQQRRTYMGSRQRPSDTQTEPTIYVSPANLPPPPKYEALAPPSYEEVVGIHYPNFQPIAQPITTALAQGSNTTNTTDANNINNAVTTDNEISVNNENRVNNEINVNSVNSSPSTVITVPVAASS